MFDFLKKKKHDSEPIANRVFDGKVNFAMTEAYNFLRASLKFAIPNKKNGKVIGITSPCPHDGKSYTSTNLAYSLAKNGHSVLLVDADMRKSALAALLNLPVSPGLSNILSGETETDEATHFAVVNQNLCVIISGDFPPNPAELIESDRMKEMLEKAAEKYEYVIIDLPPVMSVADPLLVSKYIDGMILVLRHGISRKKNVQNAVRQLKFAGVHIIGFVYNGYRHSSFYKGNEYKNYSNYDEIYNNYGNNEPAKSADSKK